METRNTKVKVKDKELVILQPQPTHLPSPLLSLRFNDILLKEMIKYFSLKDQISLSKTCQYFQGLFKANLNKLAFEQLLQAILDDDRGTVKRILDAKPELLQQVPEKDLVIESKLTWQRFHAEKPLKMALERRQLEMVKILLPYFETLKNGKEEALAQWKVREVSEQEKAQYALKMKVLIDVIAKETFSNGTQQDRLIDRISEETRAALEAHRKELLPDVAITLNNYVDVEEFLAAGYTVYHDHFNVFQNWNQCDLYCVAVLGFSQGVQSPELGKVFCESLYDVVEENKPISARSAALKLADNETSFYRSTRASLTGLGFDHLIGARRGGLPARGPGRGGLAGASGVLKNYVEQKQMSLAGFRQSLSQEIGHDTSPRNKALA
ncbi:MAG TPA: hypothetical protein VJN02_04885 [Gammaproteobacteria bacterium]|nr:hypothetical protein [Gammaproteobacteria bacterium]